MQPEEAKRLAELEDENKRLKKLLAESELEKDVFKTFNTLLKKHNARNSPGIRWRSPKSTPSSSWQNGCCESFNSKFEDEFLSRNIFESLRSAAGLTAMFELEYNAYRPHSSLRYVPPSKFAAQLPPPSTLVASLPSPQAAAAGRDR